MLQSGNNSHTVAESISYLATANGAILVLYIAALSIYRLYFHPLAKSPGPKLNAISSLPSVYSLLRGRLPLDNKRLHDKYGSVPSIYKRAGL